MIDPAAVLPQRPRAFLAALLHRLPVGVLHRLRLLVRPNTTAYPTASWVAQAAKNLAFRLTWPDGIFGKRTSANQAPPA